MVVEPAVHAVHDESAGSLLSKPCMVQESEAAGELSFAEFKRQRRAEEDDAEFPDEVHCTSPYIL